MTLWFAAAYSAEHEVTGVIMRGELSWLTSCSAEEFCVRLPLPLEPADMVPRIYARGVASDAHRGRHEYLAGNHHRGSHSLSR